MNSRERMLAVINHERPDRIPTDFWATPEIVQRLTSHFGSYQEAMEALHIDGMAGSGPSYIGPPLPETAEDESVDYWGIRLREKRHGTGSYAEQYFFPLASATTIDDAEKYQWPQVDWFDFSAMKADLKVKREKQVVSCGYMAPFYFHNLLRGLETSLIDPHDDPEFTHHILGRISDFFYEFHARMFEECKGLIDVTQVTDDLGGQTGPLISLNTFREFYAPHLKRFIDLSHSFNIKVFHHDDGAIRPFIPELIDMGIDVLNPVQWTCPGMDMVELKRDFGDKLCFHGAVENQRVLPFGTPDDVRTEVRHCIDALASDGTGYILASCHNLQSSTPMENILAMYDEAYHYGRL